MSGREIVAAYCWCPGASMYSSWLAAGSFGHRSWSVCWSMGLAISLNSLFPNRSKTFFMYPAWLIYDNLDHSTIIPMKNLRSLRALIWNSCRSDPQILTLLSSKCIISSTYADSGFMDWFSVPHSTYIPGCVFNICIPIDMRKLSSVSNELGLVCFKLYRSFSSFTWACLSELTHKWHSWRTTPLGMVTYNSLLILLSRKVVITLSCFMVIPTDLPRTVKVRLKATMLTNTAEVLSKSISGCCRKPCTSNHVL